MNPILRNIIATVVGIAVCLLLNGLLLGVLMRMIGTPEGFNAEDPTTYGLLDARHYMSPFFAHAIPSFVGALIAAVIASDRRLVLALVVGGLHLLGGIAAAFMIPAPAWFIALDLAVAYMPMAWLGGKLGIATRRWTRSPQP